MKKLARLAWVERTFGKSCVMPYRTCQNWDQIAAAIEWHDSIPRTWGMRTDFANGRSEQGYGLPFLFHGSRMGAQELWGLHQKKLVYIVVQNIPIVKFHAVAMRINPEHVFFEWNAKEPESSQRDMYRHLENLQTLIVGPSSFFPWNGEIWRSFNPEDCTALRFDLVYDTMQAYGLDEATFSVAPDSRLVVW